MELMFLVLCRVAAQSEQDIRLRSIAQGLPGMQRMKLIRIIGARQGFEITLRLTSIRVTITDQLQSNKTTSSTRHEASILPVTEMGT